MSAPDVAARSAGLWNTACAAALAEMPGMSPIRLRRLLESMSPDQAWAALAKSQKGNVDPITVYEKYVASGCRVLIATDAEYPTRLLADPERPEVLFARGDLEALEAPAVAIIGTRRATPSGRAIAEDFAEQLSARGVCVVSGLALGIDAAAHGGALQHFDTVKPIGVVGSGLDVVYPRRSRELWREIGNCGLLLSEAPLNAPPEQWRFPARNRIIAALSDVVVVVESHAKGGSLLTVNDAIKRSVEVMAVPGSLANPAAAGTNAMLRDGAAPVCDVEDILLALGSKAPAQTNTQAVSRAQDDPETVQLPLVLDESECRVLEVMASEGSRLDDIYSRAGLSPQAVSKALVSVQAAKLAQQEAGLWFRVR